MAGDGIEHHTEVRRGRRLAPIVVAVGALVLIAVVAVLRSGGDPTPAATPTTSSPVPPATRPARLAVVHVVADTDSGPRPATTANGPGTARGTTFDSIQATPIVTDGQIVVLADGGMLLAGRPGDGFRPVGPDTPSSAVAASNEPGHVWVVTPEDDLVLVDLDGLDPPVRVPLGGDRVLGPATFGVVTVSPEGAVSWRRPSFDPALVAFPSPRRAVDAGGDVVLVERSLGADVGRGFELWSIVDGTVVADFVEAPSDRPAVVAPDGTVVALPDPFGWTVRDVRSRAELGALAHRSAGVPVWIGDGRFALLVDGTVVVSDGSELSPPWRLQALAEQSP